MPFRFATWCRGCSAASFNLSLFFYLKYPIILQFLKWCLPGQRCSCTRPWARQRSWHGHHQHFCQPLAAAHAQHSANGVRYVRTLSVWAPSHWQTRVYELIVLQSSMRLKYYTWCNTICLAEGRSKVCDIESANNQNTVVQELGAGVSASTPIPSCWMLGAQDFRIVLACTNTWLMCLLVDCKIDRL